MIVLTANVDCVFCGDTFEGVWEIDSEDVQDMDSIPVADQECSGCGSVESVEWPGWCNYTEAGLGLIHQIKITGFQSLKRLEVRLGKFTVITGPTGTGKSAFIRAVRLLAFNAWGTSYISRGQKTCNVVMSGSDDKDTAWVVDIQRGGKDSYHVIDGGLPSDDKTFTKLAGKVPEQVTSVLRISEVNFAGQFDRPYLLDSTGTEVSRVLGRLTNVTLLYRAAQEANRRRLAVSSRLKTRQSDLDVLQSKISEYENLPDEKAAVELAEEGLRRLRFLIGTRERLYFLASSLSRLTGARDALEGQQVPDIPSLENLELLASSRSRLFVLSSMLTKDQAHLVNARWREEGCAKEEAQAQKEMEEYMAQWGVCQACGQPVRREHGH